MGKQLVFSFQGYKRWCDTAWFRVRGRKTTNWFIETIINGIKKMVVFFGGIAKATKRARRDRLITEAQGTEGKEALAMIDRSFGIGDMFKGR